MGIKVQLTRVLSVLALAAASIPPTHAQSPTEERLRAALRRTAQELQAIRATQSSQAAALAAAQAERDRLAAQLANRPRPTQTVVSTGISASAYASVQAQLRSAQATLAARDEALARLQAENATLVTATNTANQQRATEFTAATQRYDTLIAECTRRNDAMFALGRELTTLYRDPDFLSEVRGPVSGLLGFKRTRLENRMQDYADRLYTLRYPPQQALPAAPPAPAN